MPKDPLPASSPGKLPTNEIDIGHVAPSFASEELWNTLVIRAQYRLSLRLGDIDPLFKDEPNTEKGRMARLQALGLFYWPLDHSKAQQAFRGLPATPGTAAKGIIKTIWNKFFTSAPPPVPATDAVMGAWEYFWHKILGLDSDATADAKLKEMLEARILADLPPPAEDPDHPGLSNFAKVRIPGGYTIMKSWQANSLGFNDDLTKYSFGLGDDQYNLETKFRTANPVIGKIPLVATVEKLDPYSMEWKPHKDSYVYFQLVPAYKLPDFDKTLDVNAPTQFNRPPLRESSIGPTATALTGKGPAKFAKPLEEPTDGTKPDASDPQQFNAHHTHGGLRGQGSLSDCTDVANHIFLTSSTPGFNAAHAPARATAPDLYTVAEKATAKGKSHRHAVRAKTNDKGEAGVIFNPSRCGGDTYRLRAYIGPADVNAPKPHETDGSSERAVRVDTGTMVVWRNLRISRYMKMPFGSVNQVLLDQLTTTPGTGEAPYFIANSTDYLWCGYVFDDAINNVGMEDISMSLKVRAGFSTQVGMGAGFDSAPVNFARAFFDVEFDPGAHPEAISDAEWQAARRTVLADAMAKQSDLGLNLNLAVLMFMEPGAPALTAADAVTLVPLRSPEAYNAHKLVKAAQKIDIDGTLGTGNTAALIGNQLADEILAVGMSRHFARNGYMPGLTPVQAVYGNTYSLLSRQVSGMGNSSSGSSHEYRAGVLYGGKAFYSDTTRIISFTGPGPFAPPWIGYDTTSNGCHELGHVLLRLHGPGSDVGGNAGGGNSAAKHDPINDSICVMSYKSCEGNYCAKCLFAFRGWK